MPSTTSTQAGLGNLDRPKGATKDGPMRWPTCAGPGCKVTHFFVYGYVMGDDGALRAVHGRDCDAAFKGKRTLYRLTHRVVVELRPAPKAA